MNIEEFLVKHSEEDVAEQRVEEVVEPEEIDVQKAVVEELAAEKVIKEEEIENLKKERDSLVKELTAAKTQCEALSSKIAELKKAFEEMGDVLLKNSEKEASNQIALLDRNIECDDRFPGETRDHIIEIIRQTRDRDEQEGRIRRAQLLEAVLAVNESEGTLATRRQELEKLFNENANVLSGPVIEELKRLGISHKHGEEYLLPDEIIKRTY
jgi:hypothetical protein